MSFANVYTHRKVAEDAAKGCDICYRATSSVLVAPEKKDFFYVCPSHLKDKNFCSPIIDQAAVEARKKKEMDDELERVKQEYEEKQKAKSKAKDDKEKEKGDDKDKDASKEQEDNEKQKPDAKSEEKSSPQAPATPTEEEPRVFALHKNFFGMRLERKRQIEIAKRNRERIAQPNFFPTVPKDTPGDSPST